MLITSGVFEPGFRGGGPVRSIAQVLDTAPAAMRIYMITKDRDVGSREPYPGLSGTWAQRGTTRIFYLNSRSPRQWWKLWRDLRSKSFSLLYANSLWAPATTAVPVLAGMLGLAKYRRVLIAPRGELASGALAVKAGKKKIALAIWSRVLRHSGVVWHATAGHEAAAIKALDPQAEVFTVPVQTSLPPEPLTIRQVPNKVTRLVYISRIAPNKNVHLLIAALRDCAGSIELDIYGPVHDPSYWALCRDAMRGLPADIKVSYRGEVAPSEVRATFAAYDAFVFPSGGENFGHAIAESLSAACPVICSDATPWTDVLRDGGGRVLSELSAPAIALEVTRLAAMPAADRLRLRELAAEAYRRWRSKSGSRNVLAVVSGTT